MTPACQSKTFGQYSDNEFTNHLVSKTRCTSINRLDVVFDVYRKKSIKSFAREERGAGTRIRVTSSTPVTRNWRSFLRVNENKEELFRLLTSKCLNIEKLSTIQVNFAVDDEVYKNYESEGGLPLSPCSHEEADTRMFVHVKNMANSGHQKVMIKTVDTDVVIIALALFSELNLEELWIEFGNGKDRRWLPIHKYATELGGQMCSGLLFWYSFTGCDTTSSFAGKGKKTAWETWRSYPEVTEVFARLSNAPATIAECDFAVLERFVVLMYDRSSLCATVNAARRQIFTKKGRPVDGLPPTKDALLQHTRRATYQAG